MVEVGVPTHEVRFTVLGRAAQAVYPALIGPLLIVMSLLEPALLADWIYLGLGGGLLLTCLGIRALRSGVAVRHGQVECRRVWSTLRVPLAQVANLEVSTSVVPTYWVPSPFTQTYGLVVVARDGRRIARASIFGRRRNVERAITLLRSDVSRARTTSAG